MLVGLGCVIVGNIILWQTDEETTQFFTGWVFGIFALIMSASVSRVPRAVLAATACLFIVMNEQTLTTPAVEIECVNGEQRVIAGQIKCVCKPPYVGDACESCAVGAIIDSGVNGTDAVCTTCEHQYVYPHCNSLLPGYETESQCKDRWIASCKSSSISVPLFFDKTYENVGGVRASLYDVPETDCLQSYNGTVYCDKCKDNHAGPDCCPDGKYGQDCHQDVPVCSADMDYNAKLEPNKFPAEFGLIDPKICYDADCTCGGEFIGDSLCASNYCVDNKCADVARMPDYRFRCDCDVGVGPDCVTPPCYGGTRMWNGKGICQCNAKHTDSHAGYTFDACEVQTDGKCYPGLFGEQCQECQCAVDIQDYTTTGDTMQCPKTHYGVFERDFRTKEFTGGSAGCIKSGICTKEPDDCGDVNDGSDRCLVFTDPEEFTAILFKGDNCTETKDSKCRAWEPCQPR